MNWQRWFKSILISLIIFTFICQIPLNLFKTYASENKIIKVGVYENKPKVYRANDGKITGFFPDVLNYIAQQENWQLEYVHGTWEEGLNQLKNGEIDLMVDVAISPERQVEFDFTNETVLNSWAVICVKNNSKIKSFSDLEGKKIGILKSSVYLQGPQSITYYLKSFGINAEFIYVDEYSQLCKLLEEDKIDAAVVSRIFALYNAKNYQNIKQTDLVFNPTELRFALNKNNPDNPYLIERLDYWVKKIKNKETYYQLLKKYNLEEVEIIKKIPPVWLFYVLPILIVILTGLIITIILIRRSKNIALKKWKSSEKKFQSLYESMDELIAIHEIINDKHGQAIDYKIIECNKAYNQLTHLSRAKVIGQLASKLYKINPPPFLSFFANVAKTGKPGHFEYYSPDLNQHLYVSVFSPAPGIFGTIISNMSELKQMEQSLKIERDRAELYLNTVETIIVALDKDGKIISINRKGYELLGYKKDELIGQSWFETCLLQPEGKEKVYPVFKKLVTGKGKNVEFFENKIITKNGEIKLISWHNALLRDKNKKIIGTLSSGNNITVQKQVQEKLIQSEQKFATIFATSTYAITITQLADGSFIDVNDAYVKLTGFTKKETLFNSSISLKLWANPKDRKTVVSDLQKGKPVINREFLFKIKDGSLINGLFSARIISINNQPFIMSSIADITELKQAEQKIIETKDREHAILTSIGDAVFAIDTKGIILLFNKMAEKLSGISTDQAIGNHYSKIVKFIKKNSNIVGDNFINQALEEDKITAMANDTMLLKSDGSEIPVADSAAPIKDINGKIIGCVVVFRDVSKDYELNKTKSEFVSIVSHELRAPLGIIKAFNSMIFDGDYGPINPQLKEPLSEIKNSTDHLASLVNDILNVSRLESGKLSLKLSKFDPQKLINEAVKNFTTVVNKKVNLKTGKLNQSMIEADQDKFLIILNNLLSNAVKFTNKGSITVKSEAVGKFVNFIITDTGIGIKSINQKNIFGKFQQIIESESGKPPGTGLGLYISKQLVEKMGGKIWLESSIPGKGSTFIFSLPKA